MNKKIKILILLLILGVFGLFTYSMYNANKKQQIEEQTIIYNLGLIPQSLDPHLFNELISLQVDSTIYESLLRLDEKGNITGGVAEIVSETNESITFKIRNNAKWSDGTKITANDFVFGIKRALDDKVAAQYSEMLFPIKNAEKYYNVKGVGVELGVNAIDEQTLKIDLERATPYFKYILTLPISAPIKESFYKESGNNFSIDIKGFLFNGPYKITKLSDTEIILDKNENYWNAKNIKIPRIKYTVIEDFKATDTMIKNGEIDMSRVENYRLNEYKKDGTLDTYINGRIWYLDFNVYNDNLKNIKLRKAISLVIDRAKYVNEIKKDGSTIAKSIISNVISGYNGKFRNEYPDIEYFKDNDVEQGKKLYNEALNELGKNKLTIRLLSGNSEPERREIQFIQEELRVKLGIEVKVEVVSFKDRLARTRAGDYDIVLNTWSPKYDDVTTYLNRWFKEDSKEKITTSWSKKEYNDIVKRIGEMQGSLERDKFASQAERILIDEAVIAPLYFSVENHYINKNIKNIIRRPITSITDFTYAYYEKR
jgi:oligopeptide transport system substrate-binding protein